jgi:hypothetical protein
MPAILGGAKQHLYATLKGPLGVNAADGKLLWGCPRKFNAALAPSPIAVDNERVFLTGSYDAGSVMVRELPVRRSAVPGLLFHICARLRSGISDGRELPSRSS